MASPTPVLTAGSVAATVAASARLEAREAGLRYLLDQRPGLSRHREKDPAAPFSYTDAHGKKLTDESTLRRIRHLAIPPAWENVWISPHPNGHLQATGRDLRGRKQYRYHADWQQQRNANKFQHVTAFARALPKIRRRVARDLRRPGLPREKVLATVVRLLEVSLIRVGNDEYERQNHSYGLTTLKNRHVAIRGSHLRFHFRGKSGVEHSIEVQDRRLARIVKRCQELPGQELFARRDAHGETHDISSQDVNDYLHAIAGREFTAKDFRTWAGTVLAAIALRELEVASGATHLKKNVLLAVESVSKMLGNTPSVCRKCYIHPQVLDSYLAGETIATLQQKVTKEIRTSLSGLKPEEAAVLVLLQKKLQTTAGKP